MIDGTSPTTEQVASTPDITAAPEAVSPIDEAEREFEIGIEAPDAQPEATTEAEPVVEAVELDREAILQDLDDMQSKLDAMRAKFEDVASQEPLKSPLTEAAEPVDEAVAAQAADMFVEPPAEDAPSNVTPLFTRGQVPAAPTEPQELITEVPEHLQATPAPELHVVQDVIDTTAVPSSEPVAEVSVETPPVITEVPAAEPVPTTGEGDATFVRVATEAPAPAPVVEAEQATPVEPATQTEQAPPAPQ